MPEAAAHSALPEVTPAQLEAHRAALIGHCYRMLGSISEAEDAVQETMVRAWRNLERFEGRSALRTWLTRIATRVCLDALSDRMRRARPVELAPQGSLDSKITALPASRWIEPIPDLDALPSDEDPAQLAVQKQSIRLAFVAALQHLPPRQRAALLLTEVLGWAAAEVAESLDTSVAAINSALQRARATLGERELDSIRTPLSSESNQLVDRFVDAFERYDMDALSQLLRDDAVLSMPPYSLWLQGPVQIVPWMLGPGAPCRGSRLIRVNACGSPAFGQYRPAAAFGKEGGGHYPWALIVLEPSSDRIATMTYFLDTATWFPRFGLPPELPASG